MFWYQGKVIRARNFPIRCLTNIKKKKSLNFLVENEGQKYIM